MMKYEGTWPKLWVRVEFMKLVVLTENQSHTSCGAKLWAVTPPPTPRLPVTPRLPPTCVDWPEWVCSASVPFVSTLVPSRVIETVGELNVNTPVVDPLLLGPAITAVTLPPSGLAPPTPSLPATTKSCWLALAKGVWRSCCRPVS